MAESIPCIYRIHARNGKTGYLDNETQDKKAYSLPLPDLLEMAILVGVTVRLCKTQVDMMGVKEENFNDGIAIMTVEEFFKRAKKRKISLFT